MEALRAALLTAVAIITFIAPRDGSDSVSIEAEAARWLRAGSRADRADAKSNIALSRFAFLRLRAGRLHGSNPAFQCKFRRVLSILKQFHLHVLIRIGLIALPVRARFRVVNGPDTLHRRIISLIVLSPPMLGLPIIVYPIRLL